ncbi:MAG: hypothetical protein IKL05_00015 [Clostridia bacterium]|nr:hypothetical protein [Clostridia bacterium]
MTSFLFKFGMFGFAVSLFLYWTDIGFFSGFVYGFVLLLVLSAFYLLIYRLESKKLFSTFRTIPAHLCDVKCEHHSHSTKASIDIDLDYGTATYTPGTYDSWETYEGVYEVGYGRYRSAKIDKETYEKGADGSYLYFYGFFGPQRDEKNAIKEFKKVYKKEKKLFCMGLSLWGLAPIWKSLIIFIPFLVNYMTCNIIKPADIDCIQAIIWIIHISFFLLALALNPMIGEKFEEDIDVSLGPLHMQILGVFSDYLVFKILQVLISKYNLAESVVAPYDYDYFFVEKSVNILSLQLNIPPFAKNLILISLLELVVYVIVFGIHILRNKSHKK